MTGRVPPLIGLTGPIGCGKSTIGRMLSDVGGMVIDADRLARSVTAPGEPALAEIRRRFGDGVFNPDASLDRAAMAAVVFEDPAALGDLEAIVQPAVRRRLEAKLAEPATLDVPFVAVEAIKLVESALAERCDEVWLVECSAATQRQRIVARGSDPLDSERRLRTQGGDLSERLASALEGRVRYRRVSTDGSEEETRERVEDALADLLA